MRKNTLVLAVFIFFGLSHTSLMAQFQFNVDLVSRYIWRGFDLNPYEKPALQPSLDYRFGNSGFATRIWASFSFENKTYTEFDLFLTYDFKIKDQVSLTAGFIHYGWYFVDNFRFEDDTSHEIFLKAGLPEFFLNPSLTIYYDFTNGDGFYFLLDSSYSQKITNFVGAKLSASLGYNAGQWLAEETDPGFSDLNLGAALPFKFGRFSISGFANYTFVLLDAIGKENHFWYGISLDIK